MHPEIDSVARRFQFDGELIDARPYGSGHINDTFLARFWIGEANLRNCLLQRINHHVFKRPEQVMENIERVTAHLQPKIVAAGGDPNREALQLIPTLEGCSFCETPGGNTWRAMVLIEGARTFDDVQSPEHAFQAAKAFGRFQSLLADFPSDQLHETIPDFHHTPKRFEAFVRSVERDAKNRAIAMGPEIQFVEWRAAETGALVDLWDSGELPTRTTHNDTKVNNVLIDEVTGEGICVIDLDTVMPGLSLYDFGDMVRSAAKVGAEDEPDLARVGLSLEIFDQLAEGYLGATRDSLVPRELDHLAFSARLMTLECGMRFLTDYLDGDLYFKVHKPDHNLDRCRTQFKLLEDMEEQFDEMLETVDRYR